MFVTLKLTTWNPHTRKRGADIYVSGTVTDVTPTHVTLEIEKHSTNPTQPLRTWTETVTLERKRIRYQSASLDSFRKDA